MTDIKSIKEEYNKLLTQLGNPELISNWEKFETISKKKETLEKAMAKQEELKGLENKIKENELIIAAGDDPELTSLAESEIVQLKEKRKVLEKELSVLSEVKSASSGQENDFSAVIIEIRAGTGGEEAALFAVDLFKLYTRYAKYQGWKAKILDSRVTEMGGFKEVIFELKDGNVYSKMKYEAGVHRVQRIPKTEKSGRVHTSTATVAVLPKPKITEIKIKPEELKIDFYCASGPGGQYVQKRHTAVRITHLPTSLIVTSQTERNQAQNKENALSILEAKLLEMKRDKEEMKIARERKTQIGWAKRAEKIRTYNFPQNRVTDHRIKKSWQNLDEIIEGKLNSIISTLKKSLRV